MTSIEDSDYAVALPKVGTRVALPPESTKYKRVVAIIARMVERILQTIVHELMHLCRR